MAKTALKKTLQPELVSPVLLASQTEGAISARRNAAGNAWTIAFQMLLGSAKQDSFEETESIDEVTPSGAKVKTKRKTGKVVEWEECGVLIIDEHIEIGGNLYRVTVSQRRSPSGGLRPAIVLKPAKAQASTTATAGTVF